MSRHLLICRKAYTYTEPDTLICTKTYTHTYTYTHTHLPSHGDHDLSNFDTGHTTSGLPERVTHTLGETIGPRAGKHFGHTQDVVRVHAHADVVGFLASILQHVLVARDTGGLHGFRRDL